MDDSDVIISSTEIIKDRLYFATLKIGYKPKPTRNSKYFHIEDEIVYENFYFDFGPYHLCHLYQFCNRLSDELENNPKKKIVFYTSSNETLRLNAAYLIGSYQVIYLGASPGAVYKQLTEGSWSLLSFRDASGGPPLFDISLLDVLQGIKVAHDANFFDFDHFDAEQYLFYEKVENGDLNWIIPGKMLAFSGPHHRSRLDRGYPLHSPEHYHEYFKKYNVTTIVSSYSRLPIRDVILLYLNAGLGRTGTLIACYMMKHHGFSAREAIAWLRVCRPGSVIGHQQWFLENDLPPEKPVSLQTILKHDEREKLDNANALNGNETDSENNITPVISKYKTTPSPMLPAKTVFAPKLNYMMPTNNIRNANNTNLKPQPRLINTTIKSHYAAKTSTFPPTRGANSQANKLTAGAKSQFTGKSSFHGQRANLARPANYSHGTSPIKTFARKAISVTKMTTNDTNTVTALSNVTSTLSALTENCHLNGKRLPSEPNLKNVNQTKLNNGNNTRKKLIVRSTSSSRKKLPKNTSKTNLEISQELSSSDTNITNISADSLETPYSFRRKRDKSNSPEPMEIISNSIITSDVTPENFEEGTNSQGNKLYKIKALRKKYPAFGVSLMKKDGVQTRSSGCASGSTVKKK
ncbi:unnamed protein product [Leptidea sinapis]|uniref:Tyrosine specific protein phosphatases domain-containing protein n=1 Tax=Leptidea sinapis TaxID=189913 RepID=A0A5E4R3C9_9NEOP|nr:unnamed protein product [Leptidea sinapis]